jgi:tetratricopeptide (TPR) repeat protein
MAREPLPDPHRKRLQKVFEVASKKATAATTASDFDYTSDLLLQCVKGDLGNAIYLKTFIDNLQKKYNNNRKGASLAQFKERGARSAVKKALAQEQWDDVVLNGLKVLTVNPWDLSTLVAMASAAGKSGDIDCEDCYLRSALMGSPKDPNCNRLYAQSLMKRGLIDQAITFWHRVEEALPDNDEAKRAIASLTEQKARSTGKFDDDTSKMLKLKTQKQEELSLEKRLLQKLQSDPEKLSHYLDLSQYYITNDRYGEAEKLLAKAAQLSKDDPEVQEKWNDCQLRYLRQKIAKTKDPDAAKVLRREYFQKDVEFCKRRVERAPNNLAFRFDLGCRYMKTKQFAEAIQELQTAKNDPRRRGVCMLALGECFQHIEQYPLAKTHYESAILDIPERDAENRKKAIYQLGRLLLFVKDLDGAEKHLTALASLDFTYKDVSVLLDKIRKFRENHKDEKPEGEGGGE